MKQKANKKSSYFYKDAFANKYAETTDIKPVHLYYERPNLWSLLPKSLKGLKVLDVGCGAGWYAEQLLKAGAKVTALDGSRAMVELTKKRVKNQGEFYKADLEKPLDFLKDKSFDLLIAPLVIHYIRDYTPLFLEFNRVLKPKGLLVFSTHQPQLDVKLFNLKNYFEKVLIKDHWKGVGDVHYYHHSLHELSEALFHANFFIERIVEPQPLSECKKADKAWYEKLSTTPWFLFVRAVKMK